MLAVAVGRGHLRALPALAKTLPCLLLSHGHHPPAINMMLTCTESLACPAGLTVCLNFGTHCLYLHRCQAAMVLCERESRVYSRRFHTPSGPHLYAAVLQYKAKFPLVGVFKCLLIRAG